MRYRMILASIVAVILMGISSPAKAYVEIAAYNLQRATIRGTIVSVRHQECYIRTDNGAIVGVQLGPRDYWVSQGYVLYPDQYVETVVWYDPADYYTDWVFAGAISGPGFNFVLANDVGVPLWVAYKDDYYYGLGYRANAVSYMVWYDLPPTYFVYLNPPPPPPRTYTVYYGTRWRSNYTTWAYSDRYTSGGTYWTSARGYDRPTYRGKITGRPDGSAPAPHPTKVMKQREQQKTGSPAPREMKSGKKQKSSPPLKREKLRQEKRGKRGAEMQTVPEKGKSRAVPDRGKSTTAKSQRNEKGKVMAKPEQGKTMSKPAGQQVKSQDKRSQQQPATPKKAQSGKSSRSSTERGYQAPTGKKQPSPTQPQKNEQAKKKASPKKKQQKSQSR